MKVKVTYASCPACKGVEPQQCTERFTEIHRRIKGRELWDAARAHQGLGPAIRADQFSLPERLKQLGFASYGAYLKSPHWADVRQRYRASKMPKTCTCGRPGRELHHKTYKRLGVERLNDLRMLCELCHQSVHILQRQQMARGTYKGLWYSTREVMRRRTHELPYP